MAKPGSNRDDPEFTKYYQLLADIIGIFWQFHKERIQNGSLAFANSIENGNFTPFNPELRVKNRQPYRVLEDFSDCIVDTLDASWQQFLEAAGANFNPYPKNMPELTSSLRRFLSGGYVSEILIPQLESTVVISELSTRSKKPDFNYITRAGMGSGTDTVVQLRGLLGEAFIPRVALAPAKVELANFAEVQRQLGIRRGDDSLTEVSHDILDGSLFGIDRKKLRIYGLGNTLGCPAAMKVSRATKAFLREYCNVEEGRVMLEEYSEFVDRQFDRFVGDWYRELTLDKKRLVEPETIRELDGLTIVNRQGKEGNCPFRPGRERR